jgi:glycosyltransferase involved in cell wall biosynthesis
MSFPDYLFDIDVICQLLNAANSMNAINPIRFAKVKTGIIHTFSGDLRTFAKKQRRRIRDYLFYSRLGSREYPWKSVSKAKLLRFVLACVTLFPLLAQSIKGYLKKPDNAWFFHPVACCLTLWEYGLGRVAGIFAVKELGREKWGTDHAKEKPGVMILSPFYEPNVGGVETHLKDLTELLRKENKYKVFVLTYQPISTKAKGPIFEKYENIEIVRIPWIGFNLFRKLEPYPILEFLYVTPWLFIWTFIFLMFKGKNVKTVHAQGMNASFIARILAKAFNKEFVASAHAIYEMNSRPLMARIFRWVLEPANKVLALSDASRRELMRIGLREDKVGTYTYWVDQETFKPLDKAAAKKSVGWEGKFVVLFVGRFIDIKGMDVLLKVAEGIDKGIYFAFIGDGPLSARVEQASRRLNNVVFLGKVNNHNLPLYYSGADILCVPSKYEEGFGRVILEALSCGTPVVASNKGGIPEAIDETVGVLVDPTVNDLAREIECLFRASERLQEMQSCCREYAVNRFSDKNAEPIVRCYGD